MCIRDRWKSKFQKKKQEHENTKKELAEVQKDYQKLSGEKEILQGFADRYNPVSYTHLDVYKRQDVDKLDYLIRDAYITGFETVSIDYERLLRSIRIRKLDDKYEIVYLKGAISVIAVSYTHLELYCIILL